MMTEYQAFGDQMMYGKMTIDVIRCAVRVGPDGKVVKHWRMVTRAADHPARVLQLLQGAYAQTIRNTLH